MRGSCPGCGAGEGEMFRALSRNVARLRAEREKISASAYGAVLLTELIEAVDRVIGTR